MVSSKSKPTTWMLFQRGNIIHIIEYKYKRGGKVHGGLRAAPGWEKPRREAFVRDVVAGDTRNSHALLCSGLNVWEPSTAEQVW